MSYSFLELLITEENGLKAYQAHTVSVQAIFSACIVIMAVNIVLGLVLVVFIIVVFVIAQCRNMHDIAPHGATAAEALISSSAVFQEGSPEDW